MAVIEAMMVLQVKEIISNDRIVNTVQRYGPDVHPRKLACFFTFEDIILLCLGFMS